MSIPPSHPHKPGVHGSQPPNEPGSQPGDETRPVLPRGENHLPQTSLGQRKTAKTAPVPNTRPGPATPSPTTPEEAEKHFIQQSFKVEALETRATLARSAASLSQQIASGIPDSKETPLLVIHVGSNGKMTNIIPADENMGDPQAARVIRESLAKTFTEVSRYYTSEKKAALQKDLAKAKRELESSEQTLLDMGLPLPQPNLKGRGIRIEPTLLEKSPEFSRPDSHRPGIHAVPQHLSETDDNSEKLLFDPLTSKLKFPSSKEDPQPDLATPTSDPVIATLKYYQAELYQGSTETRDFDLKGDKAVVLRQSNPLMEEASVGTPALLSGQNYSRQDSAHSARKAMLFPILMNLMRKYEHPAAQEFPTEAIYAYQVGLAATSPNTAKLLEGNGSDTERKRCQKLLTDFDDVHPEVAKVVAMDVTGSHQPRLHIGVEQSETALSNSLPASIVRDIERLEMSRFNKQIAVEDLEIYQMLKQLIFEENRLDEANNISIDLAELCQYWLQGLKDQKEVTDFQIYREGEPLEFIGRVIPPAVPTAAGAYSRQREWMLNYEHLKNFYDWDSQDDLEDEY
ncbi:hypothetical protein [Endozoicomonas sp. 8E]|uniref:hypothetical protein n=1 Tax=Endozoicomonas sp. 8E TaxID=3035692 RepID=UPI0029394472|nr:hypothetical protein [Endozoicomonas sp. 8E]WOG28410.1 hypothetical protein P6910_01790 [Endozoicomonas sp. 8E]